MVTMTKSLTRKLSVLLVAAMLLWIMAPAFAADQPASRAISISSFTDASGSINIDAGKGEGIAVGTKGIVIQDGKQIAEYQVAQVNWGFSKIELANVTEGATVKPGDSAPIISTPVIKKKSNSKLILAVVGIAAAALLLGKGGGSGSSSSADGDIAITVQKTSNSTNGDATSTLTITARVNDSNGDPAADGTEVTFRSTAGSLNVTRTTTMAGRAIVSLAYDPMTDPDTAVVTVKALGKTATVEVSFISSIDLAASEETIQVSNANGNVTQSTITATCTDATGNPVTSGTVKFTASIGTIAESAPIGPNGVATATFTSTATGKATITATWSKSKATKIITVTAGPPYVITVTSNSQSLSCNGTSYALITATIKDIRNNLVANGTVVNFSVIPDANGGGNGTIVPQSSTTTNGVATAHLITKDSTGAISKSGTAKVKVDVLVAAQPSDVPAPLADVTNQTTQVQFVSTVVQNIILTATPPNVRGWDVVGNTTSIKAVVTNADGQPVPNGTAVTFSATHGIFNTATVNTTNGVATATLSSDASGNPSWNGLVDVTATAGDFTTTVPGLVTYSGAAVDGQSTATMSQTTLAAVGGQATITITAKDTNGRSVVDGTVVTVSTDRGTVSKGGEAGTAGGTVTFTLSTSTDPDSPTPTGAGTVTVSIETGTTPVVKTLGFTVGP